MDVLRDGAPTTEKLCVVCKVAVDPDWERCDRCLHEAAMRQLGHLAVAVEIEKAAYRAAREEGRRGDVAHN